MAETLCPGILDRGSEFVIAYDPILKTTVRRFGTCGQQAAHSILTNALGRLITTADIYTKMRGSALCDPSGASSAQGLRVICLAYGATIAAFRDWTDANWTDWQTTFNQHAGVNPFLFETHAGQQLVDLLSGLGENAVNLQNHYVAILGRHTGGFSARANRTLPPGYWCADGDNYAGGNDNAHNFNAANVLQFYSDTAIAASLPRSLVAVKGTQGRTSGMGIPAGWTDDGTTLKAPNGYKVVMGFRAFILNNPWDAADVPLEEERHVDPVEPQNTALGGGQRQVFLKSVLRWNNNTEGEKLSWPGPAILAQEAAISNLKQQLAQADAEIATLKQQLADALAHQGDPLATEALADMRALKALFSKL